MVAPTILKSDSSNSVYLDPSIVYASTARVLTSRRVKRMEVDTVMFRTSRSPLVGSYIVNDTLYAYRRSCRVKAGVKCRREGTLSRGVALMRDTLSLPVLARAQTSYHVWVRIRIPLERYAVKASVGPSPRARADATHWLASRAASVSRLADKFGKNVLQLCYQPPPVFQLALFPGLALQGRHRLQNLKPMPVCRNPQTEDFLIRQPAQRSGLWRWASVIPLFCHSGLTSLSPTPPVSCISVGMPEPDVRPTSPGPASPSPNAQKPPCPEGSPEFLAWVSPVVVWPVRMESAVGV